jgi:hypothetical protein
MADQINIRVPASLREEAKEAARKEGVSVNQFCVAALARAVGEAKARHFFRERGGGLSAEEGRRQIGEVLEKVQE